MHEEDPNGLWHSPGRTEKNHEKPQIGIAGRRGWGSNPEPPEYEGVLTTRSWRSICDLVRKLEFPQYVMHFQSRRLEKRLLNKIYFLKLKSNWSAN
jgi:hypothetical protein